MRIEKIEIYKFSELSQTSKEKAIDDYLSGSHEIFWLDEYIDSLKEFCKMLDINLRDYRIGDGYSYVTWDHENKTSEMTGVRLATFLYNNYFPYITKGKYYSKGNAKRYSKIFVDDCCTLTGFEADDILTSAIFNFVEKPNNYEFFADVINDCFENFISGSKELIEYQNSSDFVTEMYSDDVYEFLEDGTAY